MSKIRLVGGPFGGKVMEHPCPGQREIIIRGKRKMTRKQQWEWIRENSDSMMYNPNAINSKDGWMIPGQLPIAEALYRIAMHPHSPTMHHPYNGTQMASLPAMHPDGSVFYEYVEGSRRDLN